jgi:hypothetical protein
MRAEEMNAVFDQCVANYHIIDHVDSPIHNPYKDGDFKNLLYTKSWIDTVQWHLEDIIRDPNIEPEKALEIKRRIDQSNQDRTDRVEQIDDYYFSEFKDVAETNNARINTESPAWAIDRLSILALKLYHMEVEVKRTDTPSALMEKNKIKLETLITQRNDLSLAINQLLDDLQSGTRIMKVYRQMKMYNDPELNPVLYAQNKG